MAAVEVALNTPLAEALSNVVQPKLSEVGWSTDGDDSALSEYIILMLVNGKTQEQIASELSNDLLSLPPEDTGATEFATWLFQQVQILNNQLNGGPAPQQQHFHAAQSSDDPGISTRGQGIQNEDLSSGNVEMGDAMDGLQDGAVPTGPKSMRSGTRPTGPRLMGQISKAMDRSGDSVLHRVRPQQGTERINMHNRGPPRGPKSDVRGNNRVQSNGRGVSNARGMHNGGASGGVAGPLTQMTPQQQMQLMAMYEEQARMMAQIFNPGMGVGAPSFNTAFGGMPAKQQQQPGPSLFERVERNPRQQNGSHHKPNQNGGGFSSHPMDGALSNGTGPHHADDVSSSMEVESSQPQQPGQTICKFNKHCTKQDCPYAHQSPAAKDGAPVDTSDICKFGAACQNHKCTGSHPSPAQKVAYHTEQDCKYFPNCTNPKCVFRHPEEKLCKFGRACTRPDCKFIHPKAAEANCKFNPCLNPACIFKHAEGQQRGKFGDKVWTADQEKEHVSDRKFVDDEMKDEELVLPESKIEDHGTGSQHSGTEVVT